MARGGFVIALPQKRIHPRVLIFGRKTRAEQALHVEFCRAAHRAATPGFACHLQRFGTIQRRQRQGVTRLAAIGEGRVPVEEGDERLRRRRIAIQRSFRPPLEQVLLGEIGIDFDEARVGR